MLEQQHAMARQTSTGGVLNGNDTRFLAIIAQHRHKHKLHAMFDALVFFGESNTL
jgi:hypothetical protein